MAKPKVEIKEKEYYRDIYFLYQILNNMESVDEAKKFIKDILTKSELRMLKRRWHIANLLIKGFDIRTVASKSKTSTQTVSKVKRVLEEGEGGLVLAVQKSMMKVQNEKAIHSKTKSRGGSTYVRNWLKG